MIKSIIMSDNSNQANKGTLIELLEWTYDVKLRDGQQALLIQEIMSGLTNTDQSELSLFSAVNDLYTEMVNNPNKADARLFFDALFVSAKYYSSDQSRILSAMQKIIEDLRPGITESEFKQSSYDPLNRNNLSTAVTKEKQSSTETASNSYTNYSFQSGLYRGFKFQSYSGPIMSESGTYASYFTFYPGGTVLYGHPETDRAGIYGRYQVIENVVYITWNDGGKVSSSIDVDGSVTFYGCKYSFFQKFL